MPDLLLELLSEEIPARMQKHASADLQRLVTEAITGATLSYEGARAYATPRRLSLHVVGISARQADRQEQRKGPRLGAGDAAISGFVRAAGLESIEQAQVVSDPKKGDYYVAVRDIAGDSCAAIIQRALPEIITKFPWPKSMRWGNGRLRWVRPLHSILCLLESEGEPLETLHFEIEGVASGNVTMGHRFMGPAKPIAITGFAEYVRRLDQAHVILDFQRRAEQIRTDAENLAFAQGLMLVDDPGLLQESAGLVEWPEVLLGEFDPNFLNIPEEVIITVLRTHQKCFALRDTDSGALAAKFVLVANLSAADRGRQIIAGNQRVIAARLKDAKFFWDIDCETRLEDYASKLDRIIFHEKLGTQGERVKRIGDIAAHLASKLGADPQDTMRAAGLAKADLVSLLVGEFPELQGVMGRYYALAQGIDPQIADAIETHYRPRGPQDKLPQSPLAISLALADKLDLLAGFWAIDERPTGSKDPYGLRRAALGIIRIIRDHGLGLSLSALFDLSLRAFIEPEAERHSKQQNLLDFFKDRLNHDLRDRGFRPDIIDAMLNQGIDNIVVTEQRIGILTEFVDSDGGKNLLAGVKRAYNILRIEEKKDKQTYCQPVAKGLIGSKGSAEHNLWEALSHLSEQLPGHLARENYHAALSDLATLRPKIDGFFDDVIVNAPQPEIRANRLALLNQLRVACATIADLSVIED